MDTFWSLPGGKVEEGETIMEAVEREVKEETGLKVKSTRLLYIAERFLENKHVINVFLECKYISGKPSQNLKLTDSESNKLHTVKFIPINELTKFGFSKKFVDRIDNNFPDAGSYYENISDIGR